MGCCPVCEMTGGERIESQDAPGWVRCGECRTARSDRPTRPAAQRDSLHDEILAGDALISRLREVGYGESWLSRPIGRPLLLEYGSGRGAMLSAADWRGFEPIGVESDGELATWARDRLGVLVFDSIAEVPPMPADVVLIDRFSRYGQPGELLEALVSRLVPGGLLVITAPLLDHPLHRARGGADPLWVDESNALLFERGGISLLLLRAGLMPEQTWHHPTRPGEAVIVARRL